MSLLVVARLPEGAFVGVFFCLAKAASRARLDIGVSSTGVTAATGVITDAIAGEAGCTSSPPTKSDRAWPFGVRAGLSECDRLGARVRRSTLRCCTLETKRLIGRSAAPEDEGE